MSELPKVQDSGSSGEQQLGEQDILPPDLRPKYRGDTIDETLWGLVGIQPEAVGGLVGGAMIAASYQEMQKQLSDYRNKNAKLDSEAREAIKQNTILLVENTKLKERLASLIALTKTQNLLITIGSLVVAIGYSLYERGQVGFSITVSIIGSLMLLYAWLGFRGAKE